MKTLSLLLLMSLCVLALGACTVAKAPIGIVKDWFSAEKPEDPPLHFQVKDAAKGVLEMTGVFKAGKSEVIEAYVRKLGDWEIISIRQDKVAEPVKGKEAQEPDYLFAKVHRVGDNLILFVPPKDAVFKHLVDTRGVEGKLLTDSDGKSLDTYEIDDLPESSVPLLKEASGGDPFDSEGISTVLQRRQ